MKSADIEFIRIVSGDRSPGPVSLALRELWQAARRNIECNRARRHLLSCSDHLLDDIGIARSDIDAAVFGHRSFARSRKIGE